MDKQEIKIAKKHKLCFCGVPYLNYWPSKIKPVYKGDPKDKEVFKAWNGKRKMICPKCHNIATIRTLNKAISEINLLKNEKKSIQK